MVQPEKKRTLSSSYLVQDIPTLPPSWCSFAPKLLQVLQSNRDKIRQTFCKRLSPAGREKACQVSWRFYSSHKASTEEHTKHTHTRARIHTHTHAKRGKTWFLTIRAILGNLHFSLALFVVLHFWMFRIIGSKKSPPPPKKNQKTPRCRLEYFSEAAQKCVFFTPTVVMMPLFTCLLLFPFANITLLPPAAWNCST